MCQEEKHIACAFLVTQLNGLLNQDLGLVSDYRPSYQSNPLSYTIGGPPRPVPERGPGADRLTGQDLALWLNIVNYRLSAAFSRRTVIR